MSPPGVRAATRRALARIWVALLAIGLAGGAGSMAAEPEFATARAVTEPTHVTAYARVAPIALARLAAARAGVLSGLTVLPGAAVIAGTRLGSLGGPAIDSLLTARRRALRAAEAALRAARATRAERARMQLLHLATTTDLARSVAALSAAQAQRATAAAALRAVRAETVLRAPATGIVLALRAAAGDQVAAGQTVLVIQPAHGLWLRAQFYGADAARLRVGMGGRFLPADGAAPVPVRVAGLLPALGPGGGRPVGLVATGADPGWIGGEFGRVVLDGPKRTEVTVPTRALILDQGRWWVLLRTAQGAPHGMPHGTSVGERRHAVVPGGRDGARTFILHGLSPGAQVVVGNAYLRFHRGVAQHYQPPD